ncbi:MAG: uracil-DNA glycosylase [Pseudomonadota bacterium]
MLNVTGLEPRSDCVLCPRLAQFRADNRVLRPEFFNAPVPNFGQGGARLLIVGLAPGLKGANRTGRPFTGDYAGDLLYDVLIQTGLATGLYDKRPDDGLTLENCLITNAVRCVPPQNKPTPGEIRTCNGFLMATLDQGPNLRAILTLGRIAHEATLRALGDKPSAYKFAHGAVHTVGDLRMVNSYHCSRYNTQTGRLTRSMFIDAVNTAKKAAGL